MLYLDASLLVAAFTKEAQSDRMRLLLNAQAPDTLFLSDWVTTEFCSALSVKIRTNQISAANRTAALEVYALIESSVVGKLPVLREHFQHAARLANQSELGLRAGDALHLAIAAAHDAELCTLDKRLASVGAICGVATRLV